MAERITKTDLQKYIQRLNTSTSKTVDDVDYGLDWTYNGVRVVRCNGSCDVTVRGSKREIYNILRGMVYATELIND